VRLPSVLGEDPDRLLETHGYTAEGSSLTLIGPALAQAHGDVDLSPIASPAWLSALNRINGREDDKAAVFDAVLAAIDAPAAYAEVTREGQIVAGAYAVVFDGWLCLEAVATDPAWRGRGLAGQVVSTLMAWGAAQGARAAGLQVQADNAPALKLYRRLGFERELYRYHYRRRA
jgi:GNAT superfamily N-acetyltransferase